jgi:hypothetical protein
MNKMHYRFCRRFKNEAAPRRLIFNSVETPSLPKGTSAAEPAEHSESIKHEASNMLDQELLDFLKFLHSSDISSPARRISDLSTPS